MCVLNYPFQPMELLKIDWEELWHIVSSQQTRGRGMVSFTNNSSCTICCAEFSMISSSLHLTG